MTNELIAALEAADGPSRELDDAIATVLFTEKHRTCIKGMSDEAGGMWMFRYPNGSIGSSLRFTSSINAAMTLVPDGLVWNVMTDFGLPGRARLWGSVLPTQAQDRGWTADGATPAIALCIAAMRAANLQSEENNGR